MLAERAQGRHAGGREAARRGRGAAQGDSRSGGQAAGRRRARAGARQAPAEGRGGARRAQGRDRGPAPGRCRASASRPTPPARRAAEEAAQRKAEAEMPPPCGRPRKTPRRKAAAEAEAKRQADEALAKAQAERQQAEAGSARQGRGRAGRRRRQTLEAKRAQGRAPRRIAEAEAKAKAEAEPAKADADARKASRRRPRAALRLVAAPRSPAPAGGADRRCGFDTRGSDGAFGPRSREMIAAWQKARNQPATGFLTAAQQQALLREARRRRRQVRRRAEEGGREEGRRRQEEGRGGCQEGGGKHARACSRCYCCRPRRRPDAMGRPVQVRQMAVAEIAQHHGDQRARLANPDASRLGQHGHHHDLGQPCLRQHQLGLRRQADFCRKPFGHDLRQQRHRQHAHPRLAESGNRSDRRPLHPVTDRGLSASCMIWTAGWVASDATVRPLMNHERAALRHAHFVHRPTHPPTRTLSV